MSTLVAESYLDLRDVDGQAATSALRLVHQAGRGPGGPDRVPGLFDLCDLIASALDAPVTIEDTQLNVLAFSDHEGVDDPSRIASILARKAPDAVTRRLVAQGVTTKIAMTDGPVAVAPEGLCTWWRVAHRIRGDEQTFGAIWVILETEPPAELLRRVGDLARLVARHFLRHRLDSDRVAAQQSRAMSDLLEGLPGHESTCDRLEITNGVSILAVRPARRAGVDAETAQHDLRRLGSALRMHLSVTHAASLVAPVGDVVYAVLPTPGSAATARRRAMAAATAFAGSAVGRSHDVTIGVGGQVSAATSLPRSRADAEGVLRLIEAGGSDHGSVVHADDVQALTLMHRLADVVEDLGIELVGPVVDLAAHDEAHGSRLLETLEAWLDAFGDVTAAAEAMQVHPNTTRYRLRRATEVGGIDLRCPAARYQAMVQIRLLRAAGRLPSPSVRTDA